MKKVAFVLVIGGATLWPSAGFGQAVYSTPERILRISGPVTVGDSVFNNVELRHDADNRFTLIRADGPVPNTNTGGGQARTITLGYAPQTNYQYWYNGNQRLLAACSNLAQAGITLKVPATAQASARVPLVINLAGWAPSGNPPAPVPQDVGLLDPIAAAGMAAASVEYRGCDNWSSPLIARTNADESFDVATSDFGLALTAIRNAVAAQGLPVDTSRVVVTGTSFSSNLIYTVATQFQLRGAIAIAGGCDYSCEMLGTTWAQPDDFRVNGVAISVGATTGAQDTLYAPNGLGSSGYGPNAARSRILSGIPDANRRPSAFYTFVDPAVGHDRSTAMVARVVQWAQCMSGARPAADCAGDNR